jgi:hypothetical protein
MEVEVPTVPGGWGTKEVDVFAAPPFLAPPFLDFLEAGGFEVPASPFLFLHITTML